MRAKEFIIEQATAQPGVDADQSGLDQALQQQEPETTPAGPSNVQIATAIKQIAGGVPVAPTGNAGIDNLLFQVTGLHQKAGGALNTLGRGINAIGNAFGKATTMQRTTFKTAPRSGSDIRRGIPANPNDMQKISQGQQKVTGITRVPMAQLTTDDLITLFQERAAGQPVNPTGNPGIDQLLERAKLIND